MARTTTTRVAPAASTSLSRARLIPPIANQGGQAPTAPRAPAGRGRSPGVPAWSASSRPARRRSSRRRARRRPRPPGPGCGCSARSPARIPGSPARPAPAGRPGPGAARRRPPRAPRPPGRSPPAGGRAAGTRRRTPRADPSSSRASRPFSRSWMMSTPAPSTASRNGTRSPRDRRASVHRYSRAPASRVRRSLLTTSWCHGATKDAAEHPSPTTSWPQRRGCLSAEHGCRPGDIG